MTEKLPPLSTQIATPSQTVSPPHHTASLQDVPHKVEPTVEEEPYTIKCICDFSDDDGNTIYCETCDTWQHIECFYPNNAEEATREEFAHSCHQCKPRPLDIAKAVERQRLRLSTTAVVPQEETSQKPKRPPSKSHKKKTKPTELQLNGHGHGHGYNHSQGHVSGSDTAKHSISHDYPPPSKKAKSSHRPTQSISSQAAKQSPSYGNARTTQHGHPPSPATTPPDLPSDFELHNYSNSFLSLYREPDSQAAQANTFMNISVSNAMTMWLREPKRLWRETALEFRDVFQTLPANIESLQRTLVVDSKKLLVSPDRVVRWQYLTTPVPIDKDVPLLELNGDVGFQNEYCAVPENRWKELGYPLPFVFFHALLPLYIDTRREGSRARYVRRSCKPNATLDTFLSGEEYHFWLVSDRPIAANEEITIPWDFRFPRKDAARLLRLLGLSEDDTSSHEEQELDATEYNYIANWIHNILSEYGGCACDLGSNCVFAQFHRNHYSKPHAKAAPAKKQSRKPKNHAISPTSTGHATNSRAASEGHMDDGADNDNRSVSGSSRSKPPSRDMTPARQGSFDTMGILTEPTDRDKKKVAMVEDSFRRLEKQPPPRKKKRTSDGTGSSASTKAKAPNPTHPSTEWQNGVTKRHYVDAGTSRSKSGSPVSVVSPGATHTGPASTAMMSRRSSAAPPSNYCDRGVQTDPVEGEWYSEADHTPRPKRRIVSLSKRLLENRHRLRLQEEVTRRRQRESLGSQDALAASTAVDAHSPTSEHGAPPKSPSSRAEDIDNHIVASVSGDTPMLDAPSASPTTTPPAVVGPLAHVAPIVVPNITSTGVLPSATSPAKMDPPPNLRVQMPPVPAFVAHTSTVSATSTPLSASSAVQSPFNASLPSPSPFGLPCTNAMAATPSPVKKKLSLSDYTKSRKAAASRPSVGTSLKPSTSNVEEPKSASSVDGSGAADSPTTEKVGDALPSSTAAASVNPPANSV